MSIEARGSIWVHCCYGQVASIFLEAKTGPRPAPKKMLDWHAIGAARVGDAEFDVSIGKRYTGANKGFKFITPS
jgi:hypothetical protein